MKKIFRAVTTVNVFGAIGYMLLVASWAFFLAIIIALLLDPSVRTLPTDIVQSQATPTPKGPSLAVIVASYAITALAVMVSLFVLVTLPYFVGKWCARMIRRLMTMLKIAITTGQLFLMKSMLATLPLIGLMIINFTLVPESVTFAAMYVATVGLSALSIGSFLVQLLIARRLKIPTDQVW